MSKEKKVSGKSNFGVYGWLLTIVAFVIYASSGCQNQTFSILSSYYTDVVGWDNVLQQSFITVAGLAAVVGQYIVGTMTSNKKTSPRKLAFCLLIASGILYFVSGYIRSVVLMYIVFTLARAFAQTTSYQVTGVMVANWFPRKRGLVMGWCTMGIALSVTISQFVMGFGNKMWGPHGAFGIVSVLCIVAGIVIFVFLRDYPEEMGQYPDNDPTSVRQIAQINTEPSPWTTKRVLSCKEFWFIGLSMSIMLFSAGFMAQIAPVCLTSGFTPDQLPLLMTLVGVAAAVGSYLCGLIDVKTNTKIAILVCDACMILMGVLANTGNKWMVIGAMCCLAVILGGGSNFIVSFTQGYWGTRSFRAVFRFMQPIASLLSSLAPVIIAFVAAKFGGYGASFWLASGLGVVSAILVLLIKDDFVEKKEAAWATEVAE